MKILVDINHPAHVHFFRNFIEYAKKSGHEVFVTASDKDIALKLLSEYKITFHRLPSYGKNIFIKIFNIFRINVFMFLYTLRIKPDVMMGIASFRVAHAAWLTGAKSYIFDDTEHSTFEILMYKPFATKIFTPSCFTKDLGPKQIFYPGYHELSYLHPEVFKPDISVLHEIGLKENEPYFILRFVSWNAGHDIGQKGLSNSGKKKIVETLLKYGKVLITSEYPLESYFEPYRISISPAKIHHLLFYSSMYIGEGGTMASEAALLGIPSVYINTLRMGYLEELEKKYELLHIYSDENTAISNIEKILSEKHSWKKKQEKMLSEKINVTSFIISLF